MPGLVDQHLQTQLPTSVLPVVLVGNFVNLRLFTVYCSNCVIRAKQFFKRCGKVELTVMTQEKACQGRLSNGLKNFHTSGLALVNLDV